MPRNRQRFMSSGALEYDFAKKLGLLIKGVARWNTLRRRWEASPNIAPIVKLTDNIQLDAGTHLALNRLSDHEHFVGLPCAGSRAVAFGAPC